MLQGLVIVQQGFTCSQFGNTLWPRRLVIWYPFEGMSRVDKFPLILDAMSWTVGLKTKAIM